ncbi:lantibiotic dehydratase [Spirosoma sordidisoli]|uniref:Lantibiotic dehydratase n=1 Tax=Spirosoma sordidisoli TaxID=2502893 RepID=A0A4Q2ULP8_9BACT|nr:lantibiotic dehydratase [Spirosoma sordidisoli]RYC68440.1 hypothetical protein EQG79_18960 [Spirosoma sordidisoli]
MNCLPFYVLRRPLLAIQTYFSVQQQLQQGVPLTESLAALYREPLLQDALYYASPEVYRQCQSWLAGTLDPSEKLLKTLYKYMIRMATRATPFGLFSGISIGTWGSQTGVRFDGQQPIRTHTRLDAHTLARLLQRVSQADEVKPFVRYRANTTTYPVGPDLRYVEATRDASVRDGYVLSITDNSHYLQRVLMAARTGATQADLTAVLTREGISEQEAINFLTHLIDNQLLLSEFEPTLTGPDALGRLIDRLAGLPGQKPTLAVLRSVQANLCHARAADCIALEKTLEPLLGPADAHMVQGDSYFPTLQNTLSTAFQTALLDTLRRVLPFQRPPTNTFLTEFRQRFYERYEEQEVPLLLALDPDAGIGYGGSNVSSALLEGLTWPVAQAQDMAFSPLHQTMLRLYTSAMRQEKPVLVLTDADIDSMTEGQPAPALPSSGYWIGYLLARSAEAIDAGDWLFHLAASGGPSAGNLLGRMAHLDADLEQALRAGLRQEEQSDPDALWAEIVHLPGARTANVLCRPVLRDYEIPILTAGSVPDEQQLPLDDLWVSAPKGQQLVIRSRRLGKRVIPRLSTAHNYSQGLAHYRFLCDLQMQEGRLNVGWDWGPLASLPQLPQVRYKNVILSRASWRLSSADWPLTKSDWIASWRASYRVPRYVVLAEADNELPLDLNCGLSCALLTEELRKRGQLQLKEWLLSEQTCWAGEVGHERVSELILPMTFPRPERLAYEPAQNTTTLRRSFPPGSEWLYLKIITGEQTAEQLLTDQLPWLIDGLRTSGLLRQWFFVRYNQPEPHLRLRFQSEPGQASALLTDVTGWLQQLTAEGSVYRIQVDTYHREVERYGAGRILYCEEWFCQESELLLPVLQDISQHDDSRRLYYACGLTDRLLDQWQIPLAERTRLLTAFRDAFSREFRADKALLVQLDQHYRLYRPLIHDALTAFVPPVDISPYNQRSQRLVSQLRTTVCNDQQLEELLFPMLHMLLNRIFPTENRRHEFLVYHLLTKEYTSLLKRNR